VRGDDVGVDELVALLAAGGFEPMLNVRKVRLAGSASSSDDRLE